MSGKIEDMKMSWPFAAIVIAALLAVVAVKLIDGDAGDVMSIVSLVINAYLLAELREVKTNVNGNTSALMAELAEYRRQASRVTDQALSSSALATAVNVEAAAAAQQAAATTVTFPRVQP